MSTLSGTGDAQVFIRAPEVADAAADVSANAFGVLIRNLQTAVGKCFVRGGDSVVPTWWLEIGYEEFGDPIGLPVLLIHGFPDIPDSRSLVWEHKNR